MTVPRAALRVVLCTLALALATALIAPIGRAWADEPPSAEVRKEASTLVEEGRDLQKEGKYGEAIKRFRRAYRLIPHPQLLFNLGQAYRLKGEKRRAIKLYREYLKRIPDGKSAALARRFIKDLKAEVAQERAEGLDSEDDDTGRSSGRTRRDTRRRGDASAGRTLRITGLVTMGLGAVGIGTGVGFGLRARSIEDELDGVPWQLDNQDRYNQGKDAESTMYIAYGLGATAFLAGAVMTVLGYRSGDRESPDLAMGVSTDDSRATVWVMGRF